MLALVALSALASAAPMPGGVARRAALREPLAVDCVDATVKLSVGKARVDVDGVAQFTTRVYYHDGEPLVPGPTLVMRGGTTCTVELTNDLEGDECDYHANYFHCANTTNLHTHGLHIGSDPDDISVALSPGMSHTYVYEIHDEHVYGTNWYHAHHHGSTALQVNGGLAGSLIVEPHAAYEMPDDLAELYEDAVLAMVNLFDFEGDGTTGNFAVTSYQSQSDEFPESEQGIDPDVEAPTVTRFMTVNGQYQPTLALTAGQNKLIRLVGGLGLVHAELEVPECTLTIVARDGVPSPTPYQVVEAVVIPAGGRADVTIMCPEETAGTSVVMRNYPDPARDDFLGLGARFEQDVVMTFEVAAAPGAIARRARNPVSAAPMPAYLDTLVDREVSESERNVKSVSFAGNAFNGVPFPGFEVEDPHFDTWCLGKVYELEFSPGAAVAGVHPLHIHVNHMQIVDEAETATDNGLIVRAGEWRDTIPVVGGIRFRMGPLDYEGYATNHCHRTDHEDQGAMGIARVIAC